MYTFCYNLVHIKLQASINCVVIKTAKRSSDRWNASRQLTKVKNDTVRIWGVSFDSPFEIEAICWVDELSHVKRWCNGVRLEGISVLVRATSFRFETSWLFEVYPTNMLAYSYKYMFWSVIVADLGWWCVCGGVSWQIFGEISNGLTGEMII